METTEWYARLGFGSTVGCRGCQNHCSLETLNRPCKRGDPKRDHDSDNLPSSRQHTLSIFV